MDESTAYILYMGEISKIIAGNFRALRQMLGGTQEEFSEVSGLSQSQISRLERQQNWKQLDKIGEAIKRAGGDPLDLIASNGQIADKRIALIREMLSKADSETLAIIMALLERNTRASEKPLEKLARG